MHNPTQILLIFSTLFLHFKTYLHKQNPQPNQNRQRLTKHTDPQSTYHTKYTPHANLAHRLRVRRPGLRDHGCLRIVRVGVAQVAQLREGVGGVAADRLCVSVVMREERCGEDEGCCQKGAAAQAGEKE